MAEPKTVIRSRITHNFAVPRIPRGDLAAGDPAHSGAEDTEAETLCQNSDVAIVMFRRPQSSNAREKWGTVFFLLQNQASKRNRSETGKNMHSIKYFIN